MDLDFIWVSTAGLGTINNRDTAFPDLKAQEKA